MLDVDDIQEESIDHTLLHCGKAGVLRNILFFLFDISWVSPSSIRDFIKMMQLLCQ